MRTGSDSQLEEARKVLANARRDLYRIWFMLQRLNTGEAQRANPLDGLLRWYVG
jgi:hypothetical protein